jgi:malate dehydrogenase (oxaloacetate-decarboxylating)
MNLMNPADQSAAATKALAEESLREHRHYRGKMQTVPKVPIRAHRDFAIWYTPGVAAPCKAIVAQPDEVYELTNRGNTVAIVSDGTRVLGLGNIGPEAGLPVMEGKALLFKYLGGVDAVALCVRTRTAEELIAVVKALEPSFGGINLEDISQPKCFRVLETLRKALEIPVWHDDQQGSATVALGALMGALKVVDKRLPSVRIALVGMGAANFPTYRLLVRAGADPAQIVACDSRGTLHAGRTDIEGRQEELAEKWLVCRQSNAARVTGGIAEALAGADVCIAFSRPGPGTIRPEWVASMAKDAIVFACANPVPEIWPHEALAAGARIVATGRSDFPNQVNNSLAFPGVFRGALDVRARTISDEMALASAGALAAAAEERGLREDCIVPAMDDLEVVARVATATGVQAQEQKLARRPMPRDKLFEEALQTIRAARKTADTLAREGLLQASASP